jgi:uncharacterized RDD family membrane protein YckC
MKPLSVRLAAIVALVFALSAQGPQVVARESIGPQEIGQNDRVEIFHDSRSPVFRMGQDYLLRAGDAAGDVVLISNSGVIEGYVRGNAVVVFANVRLAKTAVVAGSLIVAGGTATIERGAVVRQDLVIAGSSLNAPDDFAPGEAHVTVGSKALGDRVRAVMPWFAEGVLLGRPIVPRLGGLWLVVGIVFVASLILSLMFHGTVLNCAETIARKPLSTFLVGLLVLLLIGPMSVILAASVIGIAVLPFVVCALAIAWIVGRVAVTVRIGDSLVGQQLPETRLQAVRSFVIGFVVVCLAYMVPVLGFVVWAMIGVLGLGAASLAFISAFRRENPAPPKPDPVAAPVAPAVAFAAPADVDGASAIPSASPTTSASPSMAASNLVFFPRAGFFDRLAAFALDCALIFIGNGVLDFTRADSGPFLLLLVYHIAFWAWKGTTLGGIICQLRVIRVDGSPLRFVDSLVRGLASLFSIAVLGLGCFWILKDPENQAWHDKVAGTYVVKVPRNWPLP